MITKEQFIKIEKLQKKLLNAKDNSITINCKSLASILYLLTNEIKIINKQNMINIFKQQNEINKLNKKINDKKLLEKK